VVGTSGVVATGAIALVEEPERTIVALKGEIDVALRRDRTADEYRGTLAIVQSRLSVLTSLITELMLLVRAQESRTHVRLREVRIDDVVRASAARLADLAASRQVRVTMGALGSCVTYADPGLLARVCDNVLENAIRYNRDGGEVAITASFAESAPGEWAAGRLSLRVADTGSGIPAADRERVFDRFYRVDQSRNRFTGGFGLGLAIAREVLALFNGRILIESSSPAGTTVRIDLPARRDATTSSPDVDAEAAEGPAEAGPHAGHHQGHAEHRAHVEDRT